MGEVPLTRAHLESLTTTDLIRMADTFGIDIPLDLDRIFIIEELLEIVSYDGPAGNAADMPADISAAPNAPPEAESPRFYQGRGFPQEADMADSGLVESVPLPKQYNITFIEVMIRDPFWAFVFWEIKTQDKEQFEKTQDFEGYYLKISPWGAPAPAQPGVEVEGVFTVPVSQSDTARYLGLSFATGQKTPLSDQAHGAQTRYDQKQYKVELCAGTKESETILAVSSPFRLPLLHEVPTGWEPRSFAAENPVVILSGYDDFRVARNTERLPRMKRSASAGSL